MRTYLLSCLAVSLTLSTSIICETTSASLPAIKVLGKKKSSHESSSLHVESFPVESFTVAQSLESSPAILVRQSGGAGSVPQFLVRGQDPSQTRFFFEGIPLKTSQYGVTHLELLSANHFSRVEVAPGQISTTLGEDGLGGAIHFRLPETFSRPAVTMRTGAFGYLEAYARAALPNRHPIQFAAEYSQAFEDFLYFDNNGTLFNSADDRIRRREDNLFRRISFLPHARFNLSPSSTCDLFSLNVLREQGLPGPVSAPTSGVWRGFTQLNSAIYRGQIKTIPVHAQVYSVWSQDGLRGIPQGSRSIDYDSHSLTLGVRSTQTWLQETNGTFRTTIGGQWERYQMESSSSVSPLFDNERFQLPMGADVEWGSGRLRGNVGIQGHLNKSRARTQASVRQDFFLSPRASVVYTFSASTRIRLAGGYFYRAPSMMELYGRPDGLSANPLLQEERAWKVEGGWDGEWRAPFLFHTWKLSYTAASAWGKNLISYLQNAQASAVAVNIGRANILSQEILVEGKDAHGFSLAAGWSWLHAINESEIDYQKGKELPGRPRQRLRVAARYEKNKWALGYTWTLTGATYGDVANLKRIGAVGDHAIQLSWNGGKWGEWTLEGRNLADATTAAAAYKNSEVESVENISGVSGYPVPGRRIYLSWKVEI